MVRNFFRPFQGSCKLAFTIAFLISACFQSALSQVSQFIHVDQFGYKTKADKVAVLSNPEQGFNNALSYTAPSSLEIKNSTTNQTMFTGVVDIWNGGNIHGESGDRGWWFDFSTFTTNGSYYVYDAANNQKSAIFEISDNPYGNVLVAAAKMFYYNRCNMAKQTPYAQAKWTDGNNFLNALQDANCRYIANPGNASLEKNLSGGWFDAGDYNKYVSFTHSPMHDLLYAYEENPAVFTDHFNIPESENGIPDIIDELKWELDWLLKMTNADGSVHNKMGSRNYSENTSSPPSANVSQRYYGPVCTSASATIASVFAHAAIVFSGFAGLSGYSGQLQATAVSCFNYVLPFYNTSALQTDCDDGSIVAGDADVSASQQRDMLVAAAIYLFEKTGENVYDQFVINNYALTNVMTSGFWGVDATELQDALLRYTKLPTANSAVKTAVLNAATSNVTNNWNNIFGWNTLDLYRSFMPAWSYHWGSNMPKAEYASLNRTMVKAGIGNALSLNKKSAEQIHYFHGVNPLGIVYLSNMYQYGGDRCANQIYHTWFNDNTIYDDALASTNGPAPGYVVGGPNAGFTISSLSPPYNQPLQKSYLDFNTGWPNNSWEITEPAIYYQASYLRLLANFTSPLSGNPLPVALYDFYVKQSGEKKVQLYWKTASEKNNNYFEIERSVNGRDFQPIGQVMGGTTTSEVQYYSFTDSEVPGSACYYRLKQVDLNGKYEYSKVIALYKDNDQLFRIAPNPVTDYVDLTVPNNQIPAKMTLTDVSGRIIMQREIIGSSRIDIDKLPSGVYILTIKKSNAKVFGQRIFKN